MTIVRIVFNRPGNKLTRRPSSSFAAAGARGRDLAGRHEFADVTDQMNARSSVAG